MNVDCSHLWFVCSLDEGKQKKNFPGNMCVGGGGDQGPVVKQLLCMQKFPRFNPWNPQLRGPSRRGCEIHHSESLESYGQSEKTILTLTDQWFQALATLYACSHIVLFKEKCEHSSVIYCTGLGGVTWSLQILVLRKSCSWKVLVLCHSTSGKQHKHLRVFNV